MGELPRDGSVSEEAHDPFVVHLNFIREHRMRIGESLTERVKLTPMEPMVNRLESFLDFEALEAIASWQGLFSAPREKRESELDPEVEGHMKECMPQFHLRNIGRAERLADPDEDLELSSSEVEYGLRAPGAARAPLDAYQAPRLLEESNLALVKAYQVRMEWLIKKTAWPRHFCQELKESIRGPLWRYDPEAVEREDEAR